MSLLDCYSIVVLRSMDSRVGKVHVFEIQSGSYAHMFFFEYVKPCILNQLLCIFPRSYSLFCPLLHKCLMWVWLEIFLLPHLHLLGSSGFITTLPSILTRWVTRCEKTLVYCQDTKNTYLSLNVEPSVHFISAMLEYNSWYAEKEKRIR